MPSARSLFRKRPWISSGTFFNDNSRRNLFLTKELLNLLTLFETHQIAAIPFKGPVLAASVYKNLALRQFSDLDLIIHKQHVAKARELLISHGYRPQFDLNDSQETAFVRSYPAQCFERDDGKVVVDLHWTMTSRDFGFPLEPERLWEQHGSDIPRRQGGTDSFPREFAPVPLRARWKTRLGETGLDL